MLDMNTAQEAFVNMLMQGESCTAIIYCVFKPTGFFAGTVGNTVNPGYAAVTNCGRLLTIQTSSLGYFVGNNSAAAYNIASAAKLKVHKNIFGQYAFDCVFPADGKNVKVHFQAAKKVLGSGHPEQESSLETVVSILSQYETR
ncbi:MAG: hypothetical protein ACI4I1_09415 [Oscillospiraceae bacterium]